MKKQLLLRVINVLLIIILLTPFFWIRLIMPDLDNKYYFRIEWLSIGFLFNIQLIYFKKELGIIYNKNRLKTKIIYCLLIGIIFVVWMIVMSWEKILIDQILNMLMGVFLLLNFILLFISDMFFNFGGNKK